MKKPALLIRVKRCLLLTVGLSFAAPAAFATTTWAGTANYLAAPGSGGDEALVGPFDTYDFGAGIALLQLTGPNTFSGVYQTVVDGHFLNGVGIAVPQLNFSGNGPGFELTVAGSFNGTYSSFGGGYREFNFSGGEAGLYFDTTPDYSFSGDSGFKNGAKILSGTITGGSAVMSPNNFGAEQLDLSFTGGFNFVDANVFLPSTTGGSAQFFVNANSSALFSGITSVMGQSVTSGTLTTIDGSIRLTAVPVPAAAWLFISGLLGWSSFNKRKSAVS